MRREVSNSEDILDSRDIIARLEELRDEREDLESCKTEAGEAFEAVKDADLDTAAAEESLAVAAANLEEWDADNGDELKSLEALAAEGEGSPDWVYGETLIRDSYFKEYAMQLAEDCDMIPRNLSWPCNCIDWDQAARELKMDYFSVDYDGIDYWIRS